MRHISVTINSSHLGGYYTDPKDCPLYRALKEQYPNLQYDKYSIGISAFGSIKWRYGLTYYRIACIGCWDYGVFTELENRLIDKVELSFYIHEELFN